MGLPPRRVQLQINRDNGIRNQGPAENKLGLVEEFIAEFEGVRKDYDVTCRGQFTDIREEMLKLPQQASFNP